MGGFGSKPATVAPANWGTSQSKNTSNIRNQCPILDIKEAEVINKERACIKRKIGKNSNLKNADDKMKVDCLEEAITGRRSSTYNGNGGYRKNRRQTRKARRSRKL